MQWKKDQSLLHLSGIHINFLDEKDTYKITGIDRYLLQNKDFEFAATERQLVAHIEEVGHCNGELLTGKLASVVHEMILMPLAVPPRRAPQSSNQAPAKFTKES